MINNMTLHKATPVQNTTNEDNQDMDLDLELELDDFNLSGTQSDTSNSSQSLNSDYNIEYLTQPEDYTQAQTQLKKPALYTRADFEREVMGTDANELISTLEYKKNIILQGAPGVGKTYTAKRIAYAMLGCKDENRVRQVQFHQSYTYEDFICGLKPTDDGGFKFDTGPFYNICKDAEKDPEHKPWFMIIDEINRGNMSKILGEMFSLIEKDHRNEQIMLKYNGEMFSVPDNLYLIGTMNTADRGLVMLDYALRRRFAFITVLPKFKSTGFRALMQQSNNLKFNRIAKEITELNKVIAKDEMLGEGFMIGHSYFCLGRQVTDEDLQRIIKYEIMPLLDEYWYDNRDKVETWQGRFDRILNNEGSIFNGNNLVSDANPEQKQTNQLRNMRLGNGNQYH
jgi:5-methylcytosine-specific restriction protein B